MKIVPGVLAGIVAALVIAGGITTMTIIPHPAWMWAMGIGLPLISGRLARRQARVPIRC